MENGKKSFLIFDRRSTSQQQGPLVGTFNPLETRSLNEIYAIIFQLIGVPELQRNACTITFRNCSDLIYISSPCDLMGQDDISAYVIDRETPKLELDQTSTHGEFERIDSIPLQHINPMPLFTTNQKDIGQISRRGQSTEIPLERVHFIPKFYEMNQMSPKFNKFKAAKNSNEVSMIPKTEDNDGSVKNKIQKYRRENRNYLGDYAELKKENESLLRKMRELEMTLKNEQQAFCNLENRLIEQGKIAQFIKSKCEEEWEQKKSKLYSQIFAKHMIGIDSKIEQHVISRITNQSSEINQFLADLIQCKLCKS